MDGDVKEEGVEGAVGEEGKVTVQGWYERPRGRVGCIAVIGLRIVLEPTLDRKPVEARFFRVPTVA